VQFERLNLLASITNFTNAIFNSPYNNALIIIEIILFLLLRELLFFLLLLQMFIFCLFSKFETKIYFT